MTVVDVLSTAKFDEESTLERVADVEVSPETIAEAGTLATTATTTFGETDNPPKRTREQSLDLFARSPADGGSSDKRKQLDPSDDDLHLYLTDIGKYRLLTKEEEVELAIDYQEGLKAAEELEALGDNVDPVRRRELRRIVRRGENAKKAFINCNQRLVVNIAKKYQDLGLELLDLIQEGNIGLIRATEKFDHRKGFKFSTYATWWIRQGVRRGLSNRGKDIRIPVGQGELIKQLDQATRELEKQNIKVTPELLAEKLEWTLKKVLETTEIIFDSVSINETMRGNRDMGGTKKEYGDNLADPDAEEMLEDAMDMEAFDDAIQALRDALTTREFEILILRSGFDGGKRWTLDEIGERFNRSRERIRQIEARTLEKLRHPSNKEMRKALNQLLALIGEAE